MSDTIVAKDLTMRFRRCEALNGVDLRLQPGTVFALLGENGAGKTTLIRILTGYQSPTSGSCEVCGISPMKDPAGVRRAMGYVSDSPSLYGWMTVNQIGGFTASFYDAAFLARYQELVGHYQLDVKQKIRVLSKGQRAKVALALALAKDPELLVMDEPTSGLDPKVRRRFLESMIDRAATGRTVFLASHQINEVERVADQVAILHEGRIRLNMPLADLRESFSSVTIDFSESKAGKDAGLRLPEPAVVVDEETFRNQRQWLVRDFDPAMLDSLRNTPTVTQVRHRSATLEEVFIAYTSAETPSVGSQSGFRDQELESVQ